MKQVKAEKTNKQKNLEEVNEKEFIELKKKMISNIEKYYGIHGTMNKEIRERLDEFRKSMDEFDYSYYKYYGNKIKTDEKTTKYDKVLMLSGIFYAFSLCNATLDGIPKTEINLYEESMYSSNVSYSLFFNTDKIENTTMDIYVNVNKKDKDYEITILNNILHEATHLAGIEITNRTFNELATAIITQNFGFPVKTEKYRHLSLRLSLISLGSSRNFTIDGTRNIYTKLDEFKREGEMQLEKSKRQLNYLLKEQETEKDNLDLSELIASVKQDIKKIEREMEEMKKKFFLDINHGETYLEYIIAPFLTYNKTKEDIKEIMKNVRDDKYGDWATLFKYDYFKSLPKEATSDKVKRGYLAIIKDVVDPDIRNFLTKELDSFEKKIRTFDSQKDKETYIKEFIEGLQEKYKALHPYWILPPGFSDVLYIHDESNNKQKFA